MTRSRSTSSVLAAILVLMAAASAAAQPEGAATPDTADLPVTRVVAFTGGVGWFEHEGTVTGTQELELKVDAADMDDLLQSLMLQDLDGGDVRPVRYPARDPLPRILDSYALDLSGAPTLAQLLAQARGEVVHVQAGEGLSGVIVGVEEVRPPDEAPRSYLTLLTDEGLRRVALAEIRDLSFERADLRAQLAAALDAIARHRDADAKTVRLRFEGEGERRVRVGYVREMPVWKTSYRLVVHDDGLADLQGWAILDNPTDLDLTDVSVSFVAGRPTSFVTGLYEPVYVERPRVEVQTGPAVVPEADAGAFEPAPAPPALRSAMADDAGAAEAAFARPAAPRLAGAGVEALAQGAAAGAAFEYRVQEPVTILRHESAMIPIVQASVPTQRLSLFDPSLLERSPLRGVRIANDTGLHLAAGPVTVVGPAGFAGAARLGDLPPGESRILTHAVDQDVRILRESASDPQQVTAVRLRNGLIEVEVRQRIRSLYRIEATGSAAPLLVIEHPRRAGYDVVAPEPAPALTDDGARFGVRLAEGTEDTDAADALPIHERCEHEAACTLTVIEERTESQSVQASNLAPDRIAFFLENVELSDDDRRALEGIATVGRDLVVVDRAIADAQARLDAIHREQERIRANMAALDRDTSLYRRYLGDLETQEDELEALQADLAGLREERSRLQERLDALVAGTP